MFCDINYLTYHTMNKIFKVFLCNWRINNYIGFVLLLIKSHVRPYNPANALSIENIYLVSCSFSASVLVYTIVTE